MKIASVATVKANLSAYIKASEDELVVITKNGKPVAVLLPMEDDKVYVKRIGNAVVLIPEHDSWETLIESLSQFSDDFMAERQQPPNLAIIEV